MPDTDAECGFAGEQVLRLVFFVAEGATEVLVALGLGVV